MPNTSDILWFKTQFGTEIENAIAGTPFDLDMIVAIACQETGYVWSRLRNKSLSTARILELCVGDTIDFRPPNKGRKAFPRNKADLLSKPRGDEMFAVARAALEDVAAVLPDYRDAVKNPDKFCHGFGVFQRDIQFFPIKPDYFIGKRYVFFADSLSECLEELENGLKTLKYQDKERLTEIEFAYVAIAYNTGRFNPKLGLNQGFQDSSGKFYGEYILDFVKLSASVPYTAAPALAPGASTDAALYQVIARGGLKVRNGPGLSFDATQTLAAGTQVHVVGFDGPDKAWARVDLHGDGLVDGHVFAAFLAPVKSNADQGDEG